MADNNFQLLEEGMTITHSTYSSPARSSMALAPFELEGRSDAIQHYHVENVERQGGQSESPSDVQPREWLGLRDWFTRTIYRSTLCLQPPHHQTVEEDVQTSQASLEHSSSDTSSCIDLFDTQSEIHELGIAQETTAEIRNVEDVFVDIDLDGPRQPDPVTNDETLSESDRKEGKKCSWRWKDIKHRGFDTDAFGRIQLDDFWKPTWKYYSSYTLLAIITVTSTLAGVYHHEIVYWLKSHLDNSFWPGGLMPMCLLIIVSFPPLIGHEAIAMLCGLMWGPWKGFIWTGLGTLIGDMLGFLLFRWLLDEASERKKQVDVTFKALCQLCDDSWSVPIFTRLSLLPSHTVTPIMSATDMSFFKFTLVAAITSVKQLPTVYLGTLMIGGQVTRTDLMIKYGMLAFYILSSFISCAFLWYKMHHLRPMIIWTWELTLAYRIAEQAANPYENKLSASVRHFFHKTLPRLCQGNGSIWGHGPLPICL